MFLPFLFCDGISPPFFLLFYLIQTVLYTYGRDLFVSVRWNPRLTQLHPASSLTFSSPAFPVVVIVIRDCWVIGFYLWRNCSQYHVQTLSRNDSWQTTHTHAPPPFLRCSAVRSILAATDRKRINECHCFIPNIAAVCFNFIFSPCSPVETFSLMCGGQGVKILQWQNSFSGERD